MAIDPSSILLTGRVAVVTGGGSGIGRGVAESFAAFGARVAIWERDPETCARAAEAVDGLGIVTDVRESADVDSALARTVAELGPVSVLVNNAGGVFASPLLETSENGWDALYRAHLRHVLLCTPDFTLTEGMTAMTTPDALERGGRMVPMGRAGHVDEIAGAAVFLASDMASYVTGQTIGVDGGTAAAGGWYPHPQTGFYTLGPS